MKHFLAGLTLLLVLIVVLKLLIIYKFPEVSWNYKVTVTVETPEGIITGYSVRKMTATKNFMGGTLFPRIKRSFTGEAIIVDLGTRGILLSLLNRNVYKEFLETFTSWEPITKEGLIASKLDVGTIKELNPSEYPRMIALKNVDVEKQLININGVNLEEAFGLGVELKSIELEITNEPITRNIDQYIQILNTIQPDELRRSN